MGNLVNDRFNVIFGNFYFIIMNGEDFKKFIYVCFFYVFNCIGKNFIFIFLDKLEKFFFKFVIINFK